MRWRLKSWVVEVAAKGHSLDYTVSFLGQVIAIVISRPSPRSLTKSVKYLFRNDAHWQDNRPLPLPPTASHRTRELRHSGSTLLSDARNKAARARHHSLVTPGLFTIRAHFPPASVTFTREPNFRAPVLPRHVRVSVP